MEQKLMLWIFLGLASWQDYHNKYISVKLCFLFAGLGIIIRFLNAAPGFFGELLLSTGVGIVLYFISLLTNNAIGKGDALFFIISGLYLGWKENWFLLLTGISASGLYGLGLLLENKFYFQKIKKSTIPFLPFLLLPGLWIICL